MPGSCRPPRLPQSSTSAHALSNPGPSDVFWFSCHNPSCHTASALAQGNPNSERSRPTGLHFPKRVDRHTASAPGAQRPLFLQPHALTRTYQHVTLDFGTRLSRTLTFPATVYRHDANPSGTRCRRSFILRAYRHVSHADGVRCLRTSINTFAGEHSQGKEPFRVNYATIGGTYDDELDAFIPPEPEDRPTWVLQEGTLRWGPPVPAPTDGLWYRWDEVMQMWERIPGSPTTPRPDQEQDWIWDEETSEWVIDEDPLP